MLENLLRSKQLSAGVERAAHRAILHCVGLQSEDFNKPLIAVVNSWNEIVPGHIHLQGIAKYVKQGITESGGVPLEFNTIALCDGLCQGHTGMRYPLPSRDLIADSIEMMVEAHQFDGMVMIPGCDKTVPAHIMAALRINIPTVIVTAGPMEPGNYQEFNNITLTDMREYIGKVQTGRMAMSDLTEIEKRALPGPGTCAMLATANTMGLLTEVLGLTLSGVTAIPAIKSAKWQMARASGRKVLELLQKGITPRMIVNQDAITNAIAADMAIGGSTNSVLHLMAIAKEAGLSLDLAEFDRISREVPHICDLKPSGKYPTVYFYEEGGVPALLKVLEPFLKTEQLTANGLTLKETLEKVEMSPGKIIRPLDNPLHKEGGIAVLKGNLAPDGAVVKQSGVKPGMYYFTGSARVFNSMEEAVKAVVNDVIEAGDVIVVRYEGPKGGPGMREMHMITSLIVGRGMDESVALITDGRFSGSTRGPAIGHISPEAAAGGPIAAIRDGDRITIDIPNRKLDLGVSDEELRERLKHVVHPVKARHGALARYAELVTSADKGAVLVAREIL